MLGDSTILGMELVHVEITGNKCPNSFILLKNYEFFCLDIKPSCTVLDYVSTF